MIDEIKAWLDRAAGPENDAGDVRVAVAALLVEVAHVDDTFTASERTVISRLLERRFGLTAVAARQLLEAAERVADHAVEIFRFTRIINERMTLEQRIELIETLWEVAYADGDLDALEDTLLRRVGGLIYVPDRERGEARQRVLRRRIVGARQGTIASPGRA